MCFLFDLAVIAFLRALYSKSNSFARSMQSRCQLGGDGAGCDGVHANAFVDQGQCHRARQLVDAALANVVAFSAYKDIDGR